MHISTSCTRMLCRFGEARIIGRNQRQAKLVGQIDQHALGGGFFRFAVTLQLDIQPVAEHSLPIPSAACAPRPPDQ